MITEPTKAEWRRDHLIVRVSANETFELGTIPGQLVSVSPMDATILQGMIANALDWLNRRIAQDMDDEQVPF